MQPDLDINNVITQIRSLAVENTNRGLWFTIAADQLEGILQTKMEIVDRVQAENVTLRTTVDTQKNLIELKDQVISDLNTELDSYKKP